MKFTEETLEKAVVKLFQDNGIAHFHGDTIHKEMGDELLRDDLKQFLLDQYNNRLSNHKLFFQNHWPGELGRKGWSAFARHGEGRQHNHSRVGHYRFSKSDHRGCAFSKIVSNQPVPLRNG